MNKGRKILLFTTFGTMGFSALIFQIVFAKNLVLLFGLTAPAIATVLAVYFSGMALGGFIFGKLADKLSYKKLHQLYALFFILTAAYGFLFPLLFKVLNKLILTINRFHHLDFSGFNLFALFLSFVFLIFPAILFGAGFPIISKILIRQSEDLNKKVSLLYFVNTFGSVLGAAFTGFWLIPVFGNNIAIFSAAGLNIIVAGILFYFFKNQINQEIGVPKEVELPSGPSVENPIFFFVLFATGFLAIALEIVYTKTLILFVGSSTYAFSLIIIVFLLGIALGSFTISMFIERIKKMAAYFGIFLATIAFWLFLTIRVFEQLPFWYLNIFQSYHSFDFIANLYSQLLVVLVVIFPVTFFMGMIFSLGIKMAGVSTRDLGKGIGKLYSVNTFGGVLGSLLVGFFILPLVGYQKTFIFIALAYVILAFFFILREGALHVMIRVMLLVSLIFWAGFGAISPVWSGKILSLGVFAYARDYMRFGEQGIKKNLPTDELIFYKEGLSQIAVIKRSNNLFLRVNGKTDASNIINDLEHEIMTGALPLALHPNPKDVLMIGLGSGISLGSVTQFDEPEQIDMVEIDPAVVEAADYFKEYNHDSLNNPRVQIILADGRNYLYLTDKKYDVISSQPSNLWVSGNSYLFTKEYYELTREHLKDNGLMFQWIQMYNFTSDDLKAVLKTFQEVYPNTYIFDNVKGSDLFLVGAIGDATILNFKEIEKKFKNEKVEDELIRININNPYEFVSYFVTGSDILDSFSKNAQVHLDNRPFLEFSTPKILYEGTSAEILNSILSLREKTNFEDFIVGSDAVELNKYFDLRRKIIPVRVAINKGDLMEVVETYKALAGLGIRNLTLDRDVFNLIYGQAETLRKAGKEKESQAVWETAELIFHSVEIGKE